MSFFHILPTRRLLLWQNTCNIQFIILIIFIHFSGINTFVCCVIITSAHLQNYSSCKTDTLCSWNNNSPCPHFWQPPTTFSMILTTLLPSHKWSHIVSFCDSLFHLAWCPQSSSMSEFPFLGFSILTSFYIVIITVNTYNLFNFPTVINLYNYHFYSIGMLICLITSQVLNIQVSRLAVGMIIIDISTEVKKFL